MRRLIFLFSAGAAVLLFPAVAFAGEIQGTVEPIESAPEVEVCIVGEPGHCTVPASDGTYELVASEGNYKVEFVPTLRLRLLVQYYDQASLLSTAKSVGVPHTGTVTGIDADLKPGAVIEGTATAEGGGGPLAEVEVCAYVTSTSSAGPCTETDSQGAYELHTLPTGNYRIGFRPSGASAEYRAGFYGGQATLAEAESVHVTEGTTRMGVDATLPKGAVIGGTVRAASTGAALAEIAVCLFRASEAAPMRCDFSGASGSYSFTGLPTGSYQIGFSLEPGEIVGDAGSGESDPYVSQYYDDAATRAQAAAIPVIAPEIVPGIDAALLVPTPPEAPVPPLAASPVIPALLTVAPPVNRKPGCRKGFRSKKIKGKVRCVKRVSKKRHRVKKRKASRGKHGAPRRKHGGQR